MIPNQFYNQVSNFFRTKGIIVPSDNQWMQGCIDFYLSENPNSNLNEGQAFVFDQWLLADLCDVGVPCLPPNLSTRHSSVLQGCLTLQVNEVMNVGQPAYAQLQKVRKLATENAEVNDNKPTTQAWEPKGGRMLRLIMTDGVQKVFGMEYKPIPALQEPFIPGFKILIRGPIECRKGVFLLEERHLTVFGGEVDDLVIQNSLENLLLKSLNQNEPFNNQPPNLPLHRNPPVATSTSNPPVNRNNQMRQHNNSPQNDQINPDFFEGFLDDEDDDLLAMHLDQVAAEENNAMNTSQHLNSDEDEELLLVSENLLNRNAASPVRENASRDDHSHNYSYLHLAGPSSSRYNLTNQEDNFSRSSQDSGILSRTSQTLKSTIPVAKIKPNPIPEMSTNACPGPSAQGSREVPRVIGTSCTPRLPDLPFLKRTALSPLKDSQENHPIDKRMRSSSIDSGINNANTHLNLAASFFELFQDLSVPKFVEAKVASLVSKLRIKDRKWMLTVNISDGQETIEADFSPEVLEKLVGESADDITDKRDEIERNPTLKMQIRDVIAAGKAKIGSLEAKMKVEVPNLNAIPVITEVIEE
ncbi:unnamed protein product [Bemisia tabaci]|uniref:RecQ-mediated genome instability protein 1 n=2 Tax=Bemisia tabaci TaxID=7038 RepID=A0AAI8UUX7_BEMTA|nr:unnamed protein product [Bemisia tabaci]